MSEEEDPKALMKELRQFLQEAKKPSAIQPSLSSSGQEYREKWLGANEETELRNEMNRALQDNNMDFDDGLNRTLLVGSTAQQGISNFLASRMNKNIPYVLIALIVGGGIFLYGIVTDPATGPPFIKWLSTGYNAPMLFLFVVVMTILALVISRRRSAPR